LDTDAQWDGLLGVITNLENINPEHVLDHYHGLWQIEECFRVQKHDLQIRPIYHWTPHRIKAHVALTFMAFVCVKYLEYRLSVQSQKISPEKIRESLMQIHATTIRDKQSDKSFILPSPINPIAKEIYRVMGIKIPKQPITI
jgi:transposase